MNKRFLKQISSVTIALIMLISFSACGGSNSGSTSGSTTGSAAGSTASTQNTEKEPVTITFPSSAIGAHTLAPYYKKVYEAFDKKYGKEYKLKIDEIPTDVAMEDKLKIQISSNNMPDVFGYNSTATVDLAVKAGVLTDMKPYVDADSSWKESLDTRLLDAMSYDGKYYIVGAAKRNIGYFYNKEIFQKAGITAPAKTWDEFFAQCDKIKQAGFVPLSMATDSWIENLWLASLIGTTNDAGNKWANEHPTGPAAFELPEYLQGVKKLQKLYQEYTTKDAVGGTYDTAANNFFNGKTAIIANGPWMISDFSSKAPAGFDKNVGVSIFPGDGVFEEPQSGYCISAKDEDHIKGALAFIKNITDNDGQLLRFEMANDVPVSKTLTLSDEIKSQKGLFMDLVDQASKAKYKYATLNNLYAPAIMAINTQQMSGLALGNITPEQFAKNYAAEQAKLKK